MNAFEKEALIGLADEIAAETPKIEAALGSVNGVIAADLEKVAEAVVAKYAGPFGPELDAFITMYGAKLVPLEEKEEGYGLADLVAALKKLANS